MSTQLAAIDAMLDREHRRRRRPAWHGRAAGLALAALAIALIALLASRQMIVERPGEEKTVRVVLPPPPPPPPPEVQPEETPPEPRPTPIEQPVENMPPPPEPQAEAPTQGTDALTAREGAGPSNYGLQRGDGSGTRIGGRPGGGDGYAAYANAVLADIRRAAQREPSLNRGRYTVRLAVQVSNDGRIAGVRLIGGSGDTRRDAALQRLLTGLQLSRRPPDGLPVMRIELNTRSGA